MYKRFVLVLFFVFYQGFTQRNKKERVEDFNQDGVKDTLRSYQDGGSNFSGTFVKLIHGKTGEIFEMNNYGCFCMIAEAVTIPERLLSSENTLFFKVIKNELFPDERAVVDESLRWILKGLHSKKVLDDDPYFDFVIDTNPPWQNQEIELPNAYHVQVSIDSLPEDYGKDLYRETSIKSTRALLVYFAHNHYRNLVEKNTYYRSDLPLATSSKTYKVFKTAHGIIVQKGNTYKWLFVTAYDLTNGPLKLRWESIGKIKIIDDILIVQHKVPPAVSDQLFFIDIETGFLAKLKDGTEDLRDLEESDKGGFVIKDKKLVLGFDDDGVLQRLSLNPVLMAFEALDKH